MVSAETLNVHLKGKARLLTFGDDNPEIGAIALESDKNQEIEAVGAESLEDLVNDIEFKDLPEDIRDVLLDVNTYCYRVPMRDPSNKLAHWHRISLRIPNYLRRGCSGASRICNF